MLERRLEKFNAKLPKDAKQKKLGSENLLAVEDKLHSGGQDDTLKPSMIPRLKLVCKKLLFEIIFFNYFIYSGAFSSGILTIAGGSSFCW